MITGGDSGIGRAVAIAYAREGADVVIAYLNVLVSNPAFQMTQDTIEEIPDEEWGLHARGESPRCSISPSPPCHR